MGHNREVGAPELCAESSQALRGVNHAQKRPSRASNMPYAHTIGAGATGKIFRVLLAVVLASLLTSLFFSFRPTVTFLTLAFTVLIAVQALLRIAAILASKTKFEISKTNKDFSRLSPHDWPLYTVLVPLKDEAHMVRRLIRTLSAVDYPVERLQIIFITEEDDPATRSAVTDALIPPFEQVVVPRRGGALGPRTKPHALNIAMAKARGDIITIYDAEDAPHPQQLKTAVKAFSKHPNWGALQAPLDYFNTKESWLSAQFGLEYAAQFHVWIPLMVRLGLPFPLGGTSNHIRRSALNDVRQKDMFWDSYNVTEDADLSFRLSAAAWDIGYITPPTQEEAVSRLRPWTQQRTRWMKGFMQSWRVHMDKPFMPGGLRGLKRQMTLQLTLGSVLLAGFLHAPICLALALWVGLNWAGQGSVSVPPIVTLSLILGYGSGILIGAIGALRAGKPHLLLSLPLMPLYWLCLFVPTYKAAYEYVRKPYYWAKTAHGVSSAIEIELPSAPLPQLSRVMKKTPNSPKPQRPRIQGPPLSKLPEPANDISAALTKDPKAAE